MPSNVRSRSVSRSRVVKKTDLFESGESLDPKILLEDVLKEIKSLNIPLVVTIRDGITSVSYLLSVFISKEYEVVDGFVKFGFRKLEIASLKADISFNIEIVDDLDTSN